uniref:Uncharacterized protein n=1 Tax=Arundo donax TaxID=35708 RepID=A0A0A8ZF96_ARUDO
MYLNFHCVYFVFTSCVLRIMEPIWTV